MVPSRWVTRSPFRMAALSLILLEMVSLGWYTLYMGTQVMGKRSMRKITAAHTTDKYKMRMILTIRLFNGRVPFRQGETLEDFFHSPQMEENIRGSLSCKSSTPQEWKKEKKMVFIQTFGMMTLWLATNIFFGSRILPFLISDSLRLSKSFATAWRFLCHMFFTLCWVVSCLWSEKKFQPCCGHSPISFVFWLPITSYVRFETKWEFCREHINFPGYFLPCFSRCLLLFLRLDG